MSTKLGGVLMKDTNRGYGVLIALIIDSLSFWGIIIPAIISKDIYPPYALIPYGIASMYLINQVIDDKIRKMVCALCVLAIAIVPYLIILLVRGLF